MNKTVIIKEDSHIKIVFPCGTVWKSVSCDPSKMISDKQSKKNYFENVKFHLNVKPYSAEQLSLAYILDPIGVEYFVRHNACAVFEDAIYEICFKDKLYRKIFGDVISGSFLFTVDHGGTLLYGGYSNWDRENVFSQAEALFGFHKNTDFNERKVRDRVAMELLEITEDFPVSFTSSNSYQLLFYCYAILESGDLARDFLIKHKKLGMPCDFMKNILTGSEKEKRPAELQIAEIFQKAMYKKLKAVSDNDVCIIENEKEMIIN